jgi:DNA-binding NtrC family response regulator
MATKANSVFEKPADSAHLLVVSKQAPDLRALWDLARTNAWQCTTVANPWDALERVRSGEAPDLVLLDLADDGDGLHALRWLRYVRPTLSIVLIGQGHDRLLEAEALHLGARGYLARPLKAADLQRVIEAHSAVPFLSTLSPIPETMPELISEAIERFGEDLFFVCSTPAMQKLRVQAESLAQVDAPLLIVGEHGCGKESTARLIHQLSVRSVFPFLKVDCAAFPSDLLEAELFGSESGQPGKLELCEKGVIYLEDLTSMPLPVQARLLLMMQEKSLVRSAHAHSNGAGRVRVDARIMAATGPEAELAVAEGRLRRDLYYRLSAFSVYVPPLRHCREGIPLLLNYFMSRLAKQYGLPNRTLSPALLQACKSNTWRGNVAELRDFAKRYLVVGDDELALWELKKSAVFHHEDIHAEMGTHPSDLSMLNLQSQQMDGLKSLVRDVKGETEKNAIANALEETHWNRKAAARLLRISYRTLLYKIQSYGMTPPTLPMMLRNGMKRDGRVG